MRGLQRWKNKVAMVTGASGGIGEALASALAEQGMRVVLVARRKDRLEALAKRLRDGGAEVEFIVCDVGNESQVIEAFASVAKKWGGVDVLINNAGTGMMSRLEAGQWTDWCDTLKINVASYALCVREVLPQMKLKAEAQIINLSSLYAHRDQVANFSFYQASKFAVRDMTNTLRAELAQPTTHIRVGMISPGMVATEFRGRATSGAFTYESYFEKFPPLLPSDIVDAALYMLSTPAHVQVQDILISPLGQAL